ncbi:chitin deacetylase [Lunasporangiospora selenospora]|uniref:Chitin deacetylase n=1 Tax=Lunasporangiospora selenospora TaxID=979761 RepID=A0A9P6FMG6_9FUNG|nr:chitin deacetylase [Lunasporangiospora selenospora]
MYSFSVPRPVDRFGSKHKQSKATRRHITLLTVLALTTPALVQSLTTGASGSSTGEVSKLLARPGHVHTGKVSTRDFHGIIYTGRHTVYRPFLGAHSRIEIDSQGAPNKMDASKYPPKDQIPDVDSPQVQAWIKEIDWSKVPNFPVAQGQPDAPRFPNCPPKDKVNKEACWWSCDGCVAPTDIMTCPTQNDWGITFDDGPSPDTRELMTHLKEKDVSATFFIVGSRVLEHPEILKEQIEQGHHIAMHTWSHAGLTTLTNHQIVAEVKWTEKIIRDVTGLTTKYIRPPYGDTDNRVREILRQMGYETVIWTLGWDTNDWRMPLHQIKEAEIIRTFKNALDNMALVTSTQGGPGGPITLEHDLTSDTIRLAEHIIPLARARGLKPMSLAHCLHDSSPYQQLNGINIESGPLGNSTSDKDTGSSTVKNGNGTQPIVDPTSNKGASNSATGGEAPSSKIDLKSDANLSRPLQAQWAAVAATFGIGLFGQLLFF